MKLSTSTVGEEAGRVNAIPCWEPCAWSRWRLLSVRSHECRRSNQELSGRNCFGECTRLPASPTWTDYRAQRGVLPEEIMMSPVKLNSSIWNEKELKMQSDNVWYENRRLGVNKLPSTMKDISKAAPLSQIFTNHSARATATTLWSDAHKSSRHIMNISDHRNEESTRSSSSRLRQCSHVLSAACFSQSTSYLSVQDGSFLQNHSKCRLFPGTVVKY